MSRSVLPYAISTLLDDDPIRETEFIPRLIRALPVDTQVSFTYSGEIWKVHIIGPGERFALRSTPNADLKEAIRGPLIEFYHQRNVVGTVAAQQDTADTLHAKLHDLLAPLVPYARTHPKDVYALLRLVVLSRPDVNRTISLHFPKRRNMGPMVLLRGSTRRESRYRVIDLAEQTETQQVTVACVERLARAGLVHLTTEDILPKKGSTGVLTIKYTIRVDPAPCALIDPHLPPLVRLTDDLFTSDSNTQAG